ncbi:MAG: hypothetical protein HYS27_07075 [Deltaproteobacteria bacterium]|nr:hypothetical protein [Deltaproteobacteria bacterium]
MSRTDEELSALAADGRLAAAELEPLAAVMGTLEAQTVHDPAAVESLRVGCAFALGDACAAALCADAAAPAEVATRFFRLRDLLRLHEELRSHPRRHDA